MPWLLFFNFSTLMIFAWLFFLATIFPYLILVILNLFFESKHKNLSKFLKYYLLFPAGLIFISIIRAALNI